MLYVVRRAHDAAVISDCELTLYRPLKVKFSTGFATFRLTQTKRHFHFQFDCHICSHIALFGIDKRLSRNNVLSLSSVTSKLPSV